MDTHDAMAFVGQHRNGVLLTIKGSDGRPQASNISYATFDDDHEIRISVTADRAKTANLRKDPRATLHVQGDGHFPWVAVEGNALLSPVAKEKGDAMCLELRDLYRAVQGEHPDWDDYDRAMVEDQRLIISLRPHHAYGLVPADDPA